MSFRPPPLPGAARAPRARALCALSALSVLATPAPAFANGDGAKKATWAVVGSLIAPRFRHAVVLLDSTSVLVVGGWGPKGAALQSELYDLTSEPPQAAAHAYASLNRPKIDARAIRLPDGDVLVLGEELGASNAYTLTAEVLDRAAKSFAVVPPPPMQVRASTLCAALAGDGKVFAGGGEPQTGGPIDKAFVYDPAKNTWASAGPLEEARSGATALSLADGRVVVAGGWKDTSNPPYTPALGVEVYDPGTGKLSVIGTLSKAHVDGPALAELPGGWVLVVGTYVQAERIHTVTGEVQTAHVFAWGQWLSHVSAFPLPEGHVLLVGLTEAFVYGANAAGSGTFAAAAAPVQWRNRSIGLSAPGGAVYLFGGGFTAGGQFSVLAEVERYDSGFGAPAGGSCTGDLQCLSGFCVGSTCCTTACTAPSLSCRTPTCPTGTCTLAPKDKGSACDDGDACSFPDRCDGAGGCVGKPYLCAANPCQSSATCNGDGTCSIQTVADGTPCDDGRDCTRDDHCTSGTCAGTGDGQCGWQDDANAGCEGDGCGASSGGQGEPAGGCASAGVGGRPRMPGVLSLLLIGLLGVLWRRRGCGGW